MQQLSLWGDDSESNSPRLPARPFPAEPSSVERLGVGEARTASVSPDSESLAIPSLLDGLHLPTGPPLASPLPGAVAAGTHKCGGYEPGHPWHYYVAGDNALPMPVDEIPTCENGGDDLARALPKNPTKRLAKLRDLLANELRQLAADRERYVAIAERGAEALSRFDREIAYGGNDELARASALALKFNHIRLGRGRIEWLRAQLQQNGVTDPLNQSDAPKGSEHGDG